MIEVENVELDELTGTEEIPAIRLPEANNFQKMRQLEKNKKWSPALCIIKQRNRTKGAGFGKIH